VTPKGQGREMTIYTYYGHRKADEHPTYAHLIVEYGTSAYLSK